MKVKDALVMVTGGASGLGKASAARLLRAGAKVAIVDLPSSDGQAVADELGPSAVFVAADVTDEGQVQAALDRSAQRGELRAVVHCAGRGGALRILDRHGEPGSLAHFEAIVRVNLIGSFNVLRLAAARIAKSEPIEGERGIVVLTASIAAYEGQIGQIPYASSKAGIVGMTLVAARDLAARGIRVCSVAPGVFDTPILDRLPDDVKASLGAAVPFPPRLGKPDEFAMLVEHLIGNPMLNGETIRLDGALRMAAR
ncbi:MAG: SDR family NAD(P)-dependent oxidoreductase [Burkholderiaceae bacterium]|nr:SDR family NAD(P)-dependent oxidoreductase [Burkholderiaceae bacterium]